MAIKHHPDISSLMTCAAGSQPEALCGVIASHLSICPQCWREFGELEIVGLVLFEKIPTTSANMDLPELAPVTAADADAGLSPANETIDQKSEIPHPLVSRLGTDLDAIDWQPLAPGISHFQITLRRAAKGDLRLIRFAPGATLPEHGHHGEELTLVLRGSYTDGRETYEVGDFADLDDDCRHRVMADPSTGCILLIGSEKEPEFLKHLLQMA